MKTVKISFLALMLTGFLQVFVVWISGSVALLADTVHNFSDALTAVPLWVAFSLGKRPPNRRYTYGYGRAEDIAGIFIVLTIASSAVFTGWQAVDRLLDPRAPENLGWVAAAAIIGLLGNELVAKYRIGVGRQIGSAALVADGLHARTDGLTSLAVLLGAIGVAAGWERADPVIGLVITGGILLVLKHAAKEIYLRLMEGVSPDLVDQAENVLAETPGVERVEDLRMRWVGHRLRAEAKVTINCERSFPEAHQIAEDAHHRLLHAMPSLDEAIIHPNPCEHDGSGQHAGILHHFHAKFG